VTVVALDEVPALGRLYAAGLARSLPMPGRAARPLAPDALPATRLVLTGVSPEAEHLTAYQHVVGEPARDVLPAGFVHVLAFPVAMALMVRPDFPLPLLGMVHVANRVEQRRPVLLGERLDISVHAEDLRAHRAGVTVDLVAVASVGEDLAWRGVSTYLAKGERLTEQAAPADEPSAPFVPPAPTGEWRLSADVGRRYAAVSGDRNPIHLSALAARAFGFPRAIAHGMYTAARALADVGVARGDAFTWDVEFGKPVLLPSRVAVRVERAEGEHTFVGWDARAGRRHLAGSVRPRAT
jgi:acyl dehydratase